jgi:lipopolysaccharide/colanic/teichoic acid biosynthesis glycosyltransferase
MFYSLSKRILDILVAGILVVVFMPIWVLVPLIIYFDSPGPIIYRHRRIGKDGREFWLYKFRTMVKDADDILYKKDKKLLAQFKKGDWKLRNDPRITQFGRFLRALTIDEFPQLYNVMKGEMSMVGPRAYIKKELEEQQKKYPDTKKLIDKILSVKPGITGPWQTSGRNEIPFDKRAQLDAEYADHRTLFRDIIILAKTPKAMLSKW